MNIPATTAKSARVEKDKRFLLLRKMREKEITFDQLIDLSNSNDFSVINKTSVAVIIGSLPGWDRESVRSALISYGINSNATLQTVKKNPAHIDVIRHLCNSSSTQWQKRIVAPRGWPWFGNVIATLKKLDEELPREIVDSTRFLTDSEKRDAENPYEEFSSEQDDSASSHRDDNVPSDDLDSLFALDDEDDEDDDSGISENEEYDMFSELLED